MPIFPGETLFKLKATHGFPLDFALYRIIVQEGLRVGWVDFIEAARANNWWDFQTYDVLCHGMADAELTNEYQDAVKARFKAYVLKNPQPIAS